MGAETSVDSYSSEGDGGGGEEELAPQEWYRRERMELFLDPTHFFRRSQKKRKAKEAAAAVAALAGAGAGAADDDAGAAVVAGGDGVKVTNSNNKRRRSEERANTAPAAPPPLPSYNMLILAFGQGLTRDRAVTLRKNIEDKIRSTTEQAGGGCPARCCCSLVAVSSTSWKAGKEEKQENERVSRLLLLSNQDSSGEPTSASPPLLVIVVDGGSSRVKLLERIQKVWLTAHGANKSSPEERAGLIGRLSGLIRGGRIRVCNSEVVGEIDDEVTSCHHHHEGSTSSAAFDFDLFADARPMAGQDCADEEEWSDRRVDEYHRLGTDGLVHRRNVNQEIQLRRTSGVASSPAPPTPEHTYKHGGRRGQGQDQAANRRRDTPLLPGVEAQYHLTNRRPRNTASAGGAFVFSSPEKHSSQVSSSDQSPFSQASSCSDKQRILQASSSSDHSSFSPGRGRSALAGDRTALFQVAPPLVMPGGSKRLDASSFACQRSGHIPAPSLTNKAIADTLEKIAARYDSRKDQDTTHQFRVREYKAVAARVARFPTRLWQAEQLKGLKPKWIDRINEIIQTGSSSLLADVTRQEKGIQELQNVHGIGASTARDLVKAGVFSVAELRRRIACSSSSSSSSSPSPSDALPFELSHAQRIGVDRFEDLLLRMPRFEAAAIGQVVRAAAEGICPGLEVVVCGSYRRGKSMSGDVDVLLAPPAGVEDFSDLRERSSEGSSAASLANESHRILPMLLAALRDRGFVTDSLTAHDDRPTPRGGKASFMGVCRLSLEDLAAARAADAAHHRRSTDLPPLTTTHHRRVDIKVYSRRHFPFALLYFTGSGHFNRSMRLWAKQNGLQLNDDGLFPRSPEELLKERRSRAASSRVLAKLPCQPCPKDGFPCGSEKEIFAALNLEYRTPEERNVFDIHAVDCDGDGNGLEEETAEAAEAHRRQKHHP